MAANFVMTALDWARAGCPLRAKEEVHEIFHTHCAPCEFFNEGRNVLGKKGYCQKCGCHVSPSHTDLLNKILDPLVDCPLDPPKWRRSIEIDPNPNPEE
jgi:hypothetical protein